MEGHGQHCIDDPRLLICLSGSSYSGTVGGEGARGGEAGGRGDASGDAYGVLAGVDGLGGGGGGAACTGSGAGAGGVLGLGGGGGIARSLRARCLLSSVLAMA